jgi:hypothetical protein
MVPTDGSLLIIANITSSIACSSYANIKIVQETNNLNLFLVRDVEHESQKPDSVRNS